MGISVLAGCSGGDRPSTPPPPPPAHPPSLVRAHFSGTARLAADTNAAPWVSLSELPASQRLWQQTIEKLARATHQFSRSHIGTSTNDYAGIFQAVIADLVRAEFFAEVTGDSNHLAEGVLAVRLPADRAEFWRTNLLTVMEDWTGIRCEPLPGGTVGWQLKKPHAPNLVRFVRSGPWTLIGCGHDQLPLQDEYLRRIKHAGSPVELGGDAWLDIFFDGPNLPPRSTLSSSDGNRQPSNLFLDLPVTSLALVGRDSNLRLKGDFTFREPFSWRPEPWLIPTNLIRDPIISFTAVQGFSNLLHRSQEFSGLRLAPDPNQLFVWAGAQLPLQTLAAAPTRDAVDCLSRLAPQLIGRFNPDLNNHDAGGLLLATNASGAAALRWVDIPPFVTPFVTTAQDSGRDYLFAGIQPNWSDTNSPPPAVLWQYLASQTNLVYYDWEITAERAWAWRNVVNVFRHFFELPRLQPDTASIVCLNAVSNRLGNTITEVTQISSNRLTLTRRGPVCLTSLELITLAHWLESSRFPLGGIDLATPTNTVSAP